MGKQLKRIANLAFFKTISGRLHILIGSSPYNDEYILPKKDIESDNIKLRDILDIAKKVGIETKGQKIFTKCIYDKYCASANNNECDRWFSTYIVIECPRIQDKFGGWYENMRWVDFEEFLNFSNEDVSDEVGCLIKDIIKRKELYLNGIIRETRMN